MTDVKVDDPILKNKWATAKHCPALYPAFLFLDINLQHVKLLALIPSV